MSWVSVQEDTIKRFEESLHQLRDLPNAKVLEKRCRVLLKDLKERLRELDGEGHIKWRFSELLKKFEQTQYDLNRYGNRNSELLPENRTLKSDLAAEKKRSRQLADDLRGRTDDLRGRTKESERGKTRISDLEKQTNDLKGEIKKCVKQVKVLERRAVPVKIVEFTSNVCPKCRKRENQLHTHAD